MPIYRAYPISKNNKVTAAPSVGITCVDDQDGLEQAQLLAVAHDIELWDGPRFIARLELKPKNPV